jgi:hypothetical protein
MKIELNSLTSGYNINQINVNFGKIETEFKDKVVYRDEVSPMARELDMDGHRVINVANPVNNGDAVNYGFLVNSTVANLNGFEPRGTWVAGVQYVQNNYVNVGTEVYVARVTHIAGAVFATDLAAGRWVLFNSSSAASVFITTDQTVNGTKTFTQPIVGSTTTQVSLTGDQTVAGNKTFTGTFVADNNRITAGMLELAATTAGDRTSEIDFFAHGTPGINGAAAQILRNSGVNGSFLIQNTGTGPVNISAADLQFNGASVLPLGFNQTWQNVTTARSNNFIYTNTTGRPILVHINVTAGPGSTGNTSALRVNSVTVDAIVPSSDTQNFTLTAVVPAGANYVLSAFPSSFYWVELR